MSGLGSEFVVRVNGQNFYLVERRNEIDIVVLPTFLYSFCRRPPVQDFASAFPDSSGGAT